MTIYGVRRRVACYVTRAAGQGQELLVFEHVDDDPSNPSGVQIPAGAMMRFEAIETAALRDVEEESGLTDLTFERQLGAVELGLHDAGGPAVTTYVHLTALDDGRQSWEHVVTGEGEDGGMTFAWRWERLPLSVALAADQGTYVDQLLA